MAAATITTAEAAEAIGTTPRELRKFLRSDNSGIESVGKGARYALKGDARSLASLGKKFSKWDEAEKAARAAKKAESDNSDEELDEG